MIVAPVSSQVLRIVDQSERGANAGDLLPEIGDPSDPRSAVDYLSTDAARIAPGRREREVVLPDRAPVPGSAA